MFIDVADPGGPGGEPFLHTCPGCKQHVIPGQEVYEVEFHSTNPALQRMSGIYHTACADPVKKVQRSFALLRMRRP